MNYTDITLFNRYTDHHDLLYQRSYIYKVNWDRPKTTLGAPPSFTTLIQIPYDQALFYRTPIEWQKNRDEHWTLQLEDIIVKGVIDAQINDVTDDLYQLYSLTELRRNFEMVVITDLYLTNKSISQLMFNVGAN